MMLRLFAHLALLLPACLAQDSATESVAEHGSTTAAPLRVLSFNLRYGTAEDGDDRWERRTDLVEQVLRDEIPHILGLQEALDFQVDWVRERLPNHRVLGQHRDGGRQGEFSGLLVDTTRLEVHEWGEFWLSKTPDEPGSMGWDAVCTRMCVWAVLSERDGERFAVYATHFDHRGSRARAESAALIVEHAGAERAEHSGGDRPFLVLGDLNCGEDSPPVRSLRAAGLADTFRVAHPDAELAGTFNGFRGRDDGAKIDYILASSHWRVQGAAIVRTHSESDVPRYPSDHYPVSARLLLAQD